ncbi:thiamine pyrophosphate-binding protein [Allopusillimonas soli]|uniref:Thiamine pyrophosphate-binding protein n=1 Tax=Allopusillimonas soli TaxID=659016 RepID=A0A853FEA9_9BURK|nr:thiamine pyrophosphate-binding protein [Allopusillimonas soli]NYT36841.1 thiamine pyrophosphate-binding protein [Allopusillimonas soli]TEA75301.1 thiamine pyrophosphate-binding protein [Allopusillimonas soli]
MEKLISGGRFISETLVAHKVDHVFFMDAILRQALVEMEDLGIRRILAHSEKGAAYMADGYARIARRPAVCMSQSVGASNLAAGLQDAYLGQSSVIALTGRQTATMQYRNAYQEIPHEPFFNALTKRSSKVEAPEQLSLLLRQAFRDATTGQPGPVHLDIAGHTGDIIGSAKHNYGTVSTPNEFSQFPALRSPGHPDLITKAAKLIEASERPVIVADIGVTVSNAEATVLEFAEQLSIPIVSSLDAKSTLTESHPLNAGIVGTYSRDCANQVVSAADLVIFAGSNVGDQVSNNWTLPCEGTQIIQIYCDPAELGRNYQNTVGIPGDVRLIFEQLTAVMAPTSRTQWLAQVAQYVTAWKDAVAPLRNSDAVPIRPERLCKELSDCLPADAILISDTGYSSQWSGTLVYMEHQKQRYYRAAGSLGWGFPASLGAKCARPDLPVICFTGDGGFMYHMLELETALRWKFNTITVVNNNSCLAQGARAIDQAYKGRTGNSAEIHNYLPTNFAAIANEMGCMGLRVEHPGQFPDAFANALSADVPVVLDVVTDPDALAPLPWSPST